MRGAAAEFAAKVVGWVAKGPQLPEFGTVIDVADELPVHYRGGVGKSDLSELVGGYVYQSSPPNPPCCTNTISLLCILTSTLTTPRLCHMSLPQNILSPSFRQPMPRWHLATLATCTRVSPLRALPNCAARAACAASISRSASRRLSD